jgi:hypothetical protein
MIYVSNLIIKYNLQCLAVVTRMFNSLLSKIIQIIFKDLVRTSKKKQSVFITNVNILNNPFFTLRIIQKPYIRIQCQVQIVTTRL